MESKKNSCVGGALRAVMILININIIWEFVLDNYSKPLNYLCLWFKILFDFLQNASQFYVLLWIHSIQLWIYLVCKNEMKISFICFQPIFKVYAEKMPIFINSHPIMIISTHTHHMSIFFFEVGINALSIRQSHSNTNSIKNNKI